MANNDRAVLVNSDTNCVSNITSLCIPSVSITGFACNVASITANYTVQSTDDVLVVSNASACTITLPAVDVGKVYYIKSVDAGTITLQGYMGSELIDGETTQTIGEWDCITIVGADVTETDWIII